MNTFIFLPYVCRSEPPKVKNVSRTMLGEKLGRIHMKPQDLDRRGGKKMRALRNSSFKSPAKAAKLGRQSANDEAVPMPKKARIQ